MATIAITASPNRYVAMDGLRGLAALSVVAFHLKSFGIYPAHLGNPAVDLFFMMSGFVIAEAYEKRMGRLGVWGFLKIRLARLYPTYVLSLLVAPVFTVFIWLISYMPPDAWRVFASVPFQTLYLPSPPSIVPENRPAFFINGPAWSLFWEMLVNLLWALFLPRLRTTVLIAVIVAAAIGLFAIASFDGDVESGSDWPTWWVGGIRVLFGFPLGVLLHRLPRSRIKMPFTLLTLLAASSIFVAPLVALFCILPLTVWLSTGITPESRVAHELGELSYPLYAMHVPLFDPLSWVATRVLHLSMLEQGLFLLVGACSISWAILIAWDRPVREYLRTRTRPSTPTPSTA